MDLQNNPLPMQATGLSPTVHYSVCAIHFQMEGKGLGRFGQQYLLPISSMAISHFCVVERAGEHKGKT